MEENRTWEDRGTAQHASLHSHLDTPSTLAANTVRTAAAV